MVPTTFSNGYDGENIFWYHAQDSSTELMLLNVPLGSLNGLLSRWF